MPPNNNGKTPKNHKDMSMVHRTKGDATKDDEKKNFPPRPQESIKANNSHDEVQSLLRRQSSLARLKETFPQTSGGWAMLASFLLSAGIAYELKLQRDLTRPPIVLGQLPPNSTIRLVYEKLTSTPSSILSRPIQPSLLVGTRGRLSSALAFVATGPPVEHGFTRFREILTMAQDGAQIGVDWEIPSPERKQEILQGGPIRQPVVIILHGINNHSQFGYMKSLQRTFCRRGWNALAVNFRGCGGVPMTTPRGYNGACTSDLRSLVLQISARMQEHVPIFLVGNSLGANLVTKYLGEEGLAGTLPSAVAGGVSLGAPMLFRSETIKFPYNVAIGMARKKTYWDQWHAIQNMQDPAFVNAKRKGIWSRTIGDLDRAASPLMIRNDPFPPYGIRIGYENGEEYWMDTGCYKQSRHISKPFLHISAEDDFLCYAVSKGLFAYAMSNPNIMVVETRCGGHLGWQEARPGKGSWLSTDSWADKATADFIQAVIEANAEKKQSKQQESQRHIDGERNKLKQQALNSVQHIRSRL